MIWAAGRTQQPNWNPLTRAQQWMLQHVLAIEPTPEKDVKPRRSHTQTWADNLAAARQYHQREGHLNVPRTHVENLTDNDGRVRNIRLGTFISNQRSRSATLTPERATQLTELDIRW